MALWFFILVNLYFDFFMAVLLGLLIGFIGAGLAIRLKFLDIHDIFSRVLLYSYAACFGLLLAVSYAASRTDPDFSPGQRYTYALRTVKEWVFPENQLLHRGGLIKALQLNTDWVSQPQKVYYSVGEKLYSVLLNGKKSRLCFSADAEITGAVFSPDGKCLAVKTSGGLSIIDTKKCEVETVYEVPHGETAVSTAGVFVGGMYWSPDSQKICFFVEKTAAPSLQTQWFVYDRTLKQKRSVPLGARQSAFLVWAEDSRRLYFKQVRSAAARRDQAVVYRIQWYEIPLDTLKSALVMDVGSETLTVPDKERARVGVHIFQEDRRLRLESARPFFRNMRITSDNGKQIYINQKGQLCYQSRYGVRYALFGLSTFSDYLTFPPAGKENAFLIEDARWTPSGKYVLLRHYVYGLLVLDPISRRIGALVKGDVGMFGLYPRS